MPDKFHEEGTSRSTVEALFLRRNTAELISWQPDGQSLCVRYSPGLIEELATMAMAGYARSPWGGVETGGVLFGKRESDGVSIYSYRRLDSEHQFGPSYALSTRDVEHMDQLLAEAKTDDELKDLIAVGWFHSVSDREFCLTDHDVALHNHCFPAPWQVAIVLRRSRKRPILAGFFVRESTGSLPPRPSYTITLEDLRPRLPGGHTSELKLTSGSATSGSAGAANSRTGPARPPASPEVYPMPAAPGGAYPSRVVQRNSEEPLPAPVVEVRTPRPRKPLSILRRFLTPVVDLPTSGEQAVESSEPAAATNETAAAAKAPAPAADLAPAVEPQTFDPPKAAATPKRFLIPVVDLPVPKRKAVESSEPAAVIEEPAIAATTPSPAAEVERLAPALEFQTSEPPQAFVTAEPILVPAVELPASELKTAESPKPAAAAEEAQAAERSPGIAGMVQTPKFSAVQSPAPELRARASRSPEPVATPEHSLIHLVGLNSAGLNSAGLNRVELNPPELKAATGVKPAAAEVSAPAAKARVSGSPEPFATPKRLRIPSVGLNAPDMKAAGSVKPAAEEGSAPSAKARVSGSPEPFATPKRLLIPSVGLNAPELKAAGSVKPAAVEGSAPSAKAEVSGPPEPLATSKRLRIPSVGLNVPDLKAAGSVKPAAVEGSAPSAKAEVSGAPEPLATSERVLIPTVGLNTPGVKAAGAVKPVVAGLAAPAAKVGVSWSPEPLASADRVLIPALKVQLLDAKPVEIPQLSADVIVPAADVIVPVAATVEPLVEPEDLAATAIEPLVAELLASTVETWKFDPPQAFAVPEPVPFPAVELRIPELKAPEPFVPSADALAAEIETPAAIESPAPAVKAKESRPSKRTWIPKRLRTRSVELKTPEMTAVDASHPAAATEAPAADLAAPAANLDVPAANLEAPAEVSGPAAAIIEPPAQAEELTAYAKEPVAEVGESFAIPGPVLQPEVELKIPEMTEVEPSAPLAFTEAPAAVEEVPAAATQAPTVEIEAPAVESPAPVVNAKQSRPPKRTWMPKRSRILSLDLSAPEVKVVGAPQPAEGIAEPAANLETPAEVSVPAAAIIEPPPQTEELTATASEPVAETESSPVLEAREVPESFAIPEPASRPEVELKIHEPTEAEPSAPLAFTEAPVAGVEMPAADVEALAAATEAPSVEMEAPAARIEVPAESPALEVKAKESRLLNRSWIPKRFRIPSVEVDAFEVKVVEPRAPAENAEAPAAEIQTPAATIEVPAAERPAPTVEAKEFRTPRRSWIPKRFRIPSSQPDTPISNPGGSPEAAVAASMPDAAVEFSAVVAEEQVSHPPPVAETVLVPAVQIPVVVIQEAELQTLEADAVELPGLAAVTEGLAAESPVFEAPVLEAPAIEAPLLEAPAIETKPQGSLPRKSRWLPKTLELEDFKPKAQESRPPKRNWIPQRFLTPFVEPDTSVLKAAAFPEPVPATKESAAAASEFMAEVERGVPAAEARASDPPHVLAIPEPAPIAAVEIPVEIQEAERQTVEAKAAESPQIVDATVELVAQSPVLEAPALETPRLETTPQETLPRKSRWIPKTLDLQDFKPRAQESRPAKRRWIPQRFLTPSVEPDTSKAAESPAAESPAPASGEQSPPQPAISEPAPIPPVLSDGVGLQTPEVVAEISQQPSKAAKAPAASMNGPAAIAPGSSLAVNGHAYHAPESKIPEFSSTPAVTSRAFQPETPGTFFGLSRDPFSPAPYTSLLDASPTHKSVLTTLLYGVEARKGFLPLIGPSGSGKTIVLECLMEKLDQQSVDFAFIINPSEMTAAQFFAFLDFDLDLNSPRKAKSAVLIALNEYLIGRFQQGRTTVLIVDDAHKAPLDVLKEIELIGNLENRHGKLLQVVLAGQPAFEGVLDHPDLLGFRQSMSVRARLGPFSAEQTAAYIENRLANAGLAGQTIFGPDLLSEIHVRSRGLPRLIHAVCGGLLRVCFEAKIRTANVEMLGLMSVDPSVDGMDGAYESDSPSANAVSA